MESYKSSGQLTHYLSQLMTTFEPGSQLGLVLAQWLRHRSGLTGIDFVKVTTVKTASGKCRKAKSEDKPLSSKAWQQLRTALAEAKRDETDSIRIPASNLQALADAMSLEPLEREILAFVFQCGREAVFDMLCDRLVATRMIDSIGVIAASLGKSQTEVWRCLSGGSLRRLGLIDGFGTGTSRFCFFVPYPIRRALFPPNDGIEAIERSLLGTPLRSDLLWSDFDHLALQRDFMADLLAGAAAKQRRGINILVYGPPGTGKTELCKVLAASAGLSLFAIGEGDEDGDEPDRYDRLADLRLAERLTQRRGEAALLFDEMEDILQNDVRTTYEGRRLRRAGSKVFLNRVLEENDVPVFWTANSLQEFDPAFLRRMSFIAEVKVPPSGARRRLWEQALKAQDLDVREEDISYLSRRHRAAPGTINTAARSVATAGGGWSEIDFVVGAMNRLLGDSGRHRADAAKASVFDAELANADMDLAALTSALSPAGRPRDFSLCCYGPPGTGKSAFVRSLAADMGMDVLEKRGSDLLSKWVGGTEALIAEAFAEAREDERFLIIDEADSLLWGRGGAERSWEVSMVNELLQVMEVHDQPFACTTNQIAQIDPAALRRFTFKIKFDSMTPGQAQIAFQRFFGCDAPAMLGRVGALTPGDFAVVAKKLKFLAGEGLDRPARAQQIQQLLEQEVAVKPAAGRKIGFASPPRA